MGCGFLEDVYQECLAIEFDHQQIPYVEKPKQRLAYRGRTLKQIYRPDFLCFDSVILEIKAVDCPSKKFRAQVLNYLNATGFQLGLLVNFAAFPKLEHERIVR
jgi:GxxExxY protein